MTLNAPKLVRNAICFKEKEKSLKSIDLHLRKRDGAAGRNAHKLMRGHGPASEMHVCHNPSMAWTNRGNEGVMDMETDKRLAGSVSTNDSYGSLRYTK